MLCAERVLAPGFGRGLKVDPDNIDLTFNLEETSILWQIKEIMVPDAAALYAEPYQLNMYALPALPSS